MRPICYNVLATAAACPRRCLYHLILNGEKQAMQKKLAKRIGTLAAALAVCALCAAPAYAQDVVVEVPGLPLEVTLDGSVDVVTRETPADAPVFAELGLDRAAVLQHYIQYGTYLDVLDRENFMEFTVSVTPVSSAQDEAQLRKDAEEFNAAWLAMTPEDFPKFFEVFEETAFGPLDVTVFSRGTYTGKQNILYAYLYSTIPTDSGLQYNYQYFTYFNGNTYCFTSISLLPETPLEDADLRSIESILDEVRFTEPMLLPSPTSTGPVSASSENSADFALIIMASFACLCLAAWLLFTVYRKIAASKPDAGNNVPSAPSAAQPPAPFRPAHTQYTRSADTSGRSLPPSEAPAFCPLCGQRLPSGVTFCPGCGNPIS